MELLNFEMLNNLIGVFTVLGGFGCVLVGVLIIYIVVKILQWSCDYDKEQAKKKEKELIDKVICEVRKNEKRQ